MAKVAINENVDKLSNLVLNALKATCPVLSGNMLNHIRIDTVSKHKVTIVIDPPFYDIKEFAKHDKIVQTGPPKGYPTFVSYAMWVDKSGAFGTHNKSEKWATNTCVDTAEAFANQIGGEFRNELQL